MQCDHCMQNKPSQIIDTIFSYKKTYHLCPNCRCELIQTNKLELENNPDLTDEITGKVGAVSYVSGDEIYIVNKDTMKRLLAFSLLPSEYKALKKDGDVLQYMLHADFYTESGYAVQPLLENEIKKDISKIAYELYKQDWLNTHIAPERMLQERRNYALSCLEDNCEYSFEEWIEEYGFGGEIYACELEFFDCEYEDEEYVKRLLKESKLIELYMNRNN